MVDALTRGADPAEPLSPDVVVRARSRIAAARRRRASWWAGGSVALLAIAAVAVGTWAAPPVVPAAAATPTPSETADPLPAVLHAEDLMAMSEPRTRGVEPEGPRQAGLVCNLDDVPPESARPGATAGTPCDAVWVGEDMLLRLEPEATTATTYVVGDASQVRVMWVVRNAGSIPLQLDPAGAVASLVADPGSVATSGSQSGLTQVASSLWQDDHHRSTVLTRGAATSDSSLDDSWILQPGEYASGEATFITERDDPVSRVIDAATRFTMPTLSVQIPVVPLGAPAGSMILLEVESQLVTVDPGTAGDTLASMGVPRRLGEEPRADAQAALLCEISDALVEGRTLAIAGEFSSYSAEESSCTPLWVPGPIFVDGGGLDVVGDELATPDATSQRLVWTVENRSTWTVLTENFSLLVEAAPASPRPDGDVLSRLGDTVVTESSAWMADGRRAVMLSSQAWRFGMEPGSMFGAESTLFPGMLTSTDVVDVDELVESLNGDGAATALIELPLLGTPTQVLVLEVPVSAAVDG
ncbi:hypothetical protein [Demequina sediminis]|uniref:hypothetical protein n=1 Tax=Demequina sediminis TaxID=1930058 RepID=UPI0031EC8E32